MWSCEKDEKSSGAPLEITLEAETLSLFEGDNKTLKILTGNGKYKAKSSNTEVATVSVSENLLVVKSLKSGKTTVTLTDFKHKRTAIEITVSQAVNLSKYELGLGEKSEEIITISGEGTFEVTTQNAEIATAVLEGKNIKITGVKAGETAVSVTDTKINRTTNIIVTVYATVALDKNQAGLRVNEEEIVKILAGKGPFKVETDNDGVKAFEEDKILKIIALKPGQSVVTVTDTKTNQKAMVEVTVFKSIDVETSKVAMKIGEEKSVSISQGEGPYEVKSSNDVVRATIEGTNVKISALKGGKAIVTVLDTRTNRTFAIEAVVTASLQLEKTEVEVNPQAESTVIVVSGEGPFVTNSENAEIATATSDGRSIKISAKKAGRTQITVTDVKTQEKSVINVLVFNSITLSQNKVTLREKETASVNITSEGNNFKITSDNQNITAILEGKSIKITAVKAGKSIVTVTDVTSQKSVNLEVEVTASADIVLSKTEVSLRVGETATVAITSGEGAFQVSVNNDVVTATLENQNVKIVAKKGGQSEVTVSNSQTGKSAKISVTSQYGDFQVTENVTLNVNQTQEIAITGGSGQFTAVSDKENIATATISAGKVVVKGITAGNAIISVTDTQANKTKRINVTVKTAEKLSIGRKAINDVQVGGRGETALYSGMPVAELCTSENPSIAVFDKVETDEWGDRYVYVRGVGKGTTKVTISDGVTSFQVTVTVVGAPDFELLKNAFDIKVGETSIGAGVQGSGDFDINIQNTDLITVSQPNNYGSGDVYFFDIVGKKAGTTQVTITDRATQKSGMIQVTVR